MKPIPFQPLGARYLVLPDEAEGETTDVGEGFSIEREKNVHDKPSEGVIVACGTGCEEKIAGGDRIAFGKYSGYEHTLDGVKHLILQESEILGKIL